MYTLAGLYQKDDFLALTSLWEQDFLFTEKHTNIVHSPLQQWVKLKDIRNVLGIMYDSQKMCYIVNSQVLISLAFPTFLMKDTCTARTKAINLISLKAKCTSCPEWLITTTKKKNLFLISCQLLLAHKTFIFAVFPK